MRPLVLCVIVLSGCGGAGKGTPAPDAGLIFPGGGGGPGPGGGTPDGGTADGGTVPDGGTGGGTSGIATFPRVGMIDLNFAEGRNGALHLLFAEGAAERVFYATCTAECGDAASWAMVQLASVSSLGLGAVGAEGIGIDSSGRLHAMISGVAPFGSSANEAVYATCASACTQATNWTLLDISSVAQGNPIGTSETFMVAPDGALAFLTQGQTNSFPSRFVQCASSCGTLSSWSAANVLDGNPLFAKRDGSGVIHILFDQGQTAAGDDLHFYGRCASSCTQSTNWQISPLGFIYRGGGHTAGFAVTPQGKVFLAYNQGDAAESTADNRKLFLNACTGGSCLDLGMWSSISVGALGDGSSGSALLADGEELALATTSGFELHLRGCEGDCGNAAGWSEAVVVDSSDLMNAAFPPDTGSACPGTSESSNWWPNQPAIGISNTGVVVGHTPYSIVKCSSSVNPSRLPSIGRVFSTF